MWISERVPASVHCSAAGADLFPWKGALVDTFCLRELHESAICHCCSARDESWAPGEQPEWFCYWDNRGKLQLCGDLSKENAGTVQL